MVDDDARGVSLFERYPALKGRIPYVSLAQLPTPVERLERLGADLGLERLYVKRDDLTGAVYGGNKIRELEFLLGQAVRDEREEMMTFGAAGSNHATATAVCAHSLGLRSISMLVPQPKAQYVRDNLLLSHLHGAELHLYGGQFRRKLGVIWQRLVHRVARGRAPQIIPFGGSSPLGTIGFVNAGFELKAQIDAGRMPEPDCVFVAMGSMGTAAGLKLGLTAAGLKTQVMAIRVVPREHVSPSKFIALYQRANAMLRAADPSFPAYALTEGEVNIVHDYYGAGYGTETREGRDASRRARETEAIKLDRTYTAKTFAALIGAAERGELTNKVVLFWLTLNSRDFSGAIAGVDYRELPKGLHSYFEGDVPL